MDATAAATDRDAIASTIQKYIDGGISGRGDDMKPAFHKGATIYGLHRP